MTISDITDTSLWVVGRGRTQPRPVPARCALCQQDPSASALGRCTRCLVAAAAEVARLRPPPSVTSDDGRPSSVQARDLCRRCGSGKHPTSRCPH